MSNPDNVWGPCPSSAAPLGGETPRGNSPAGGSEPTSRTLTRALLAPLPHRTSPTFSYPLLPFPRSSPAVPIFHAPSGGSVPPSASRHWRTTTFVPGTGTKRPPSSVSHIPRRPSPPVPPSPQRPTSVKILCLMKIIIVQFQFIYFFTHHILLTATSWVES